MYELFKNCSHNTTLDHDSENHSPNCEKSCQEECNSIRAESDAFRNVIGAHGWRRTGRRRSRLPRETWSGKHPHHLDQVSSITLHQIIDLLFHPTDPWSSFSCFLSSIILGILGRGRCRRGFLFLDVAAASYILPLLLPSLVKNSLFPHLLPSPPP